MHHTATFRKRLFPKGGFCGMLWDIFPCLHLMFLCRRWWISCRTLSSSFVRSHLILSRLSKYPRSCHSMSLCARPCCVPQLAKQLVEVPTIISYSSLQRTVEQHVDNTVLGGGGPISVLQGFSFGQSSTATPSSKKRISGRIVEQIVDPVSSGRFQGSLPGQGSSSSHSPAGVEERADELVKGLFALLPCEVGFALESEGACQPIHAGCSAGGRAFAGLHRVGAAQGRQLWQDLLLEQTYIQYCLEATAWRRGWVGEMTEEGGVWYWHRYTNTGRRAVSCCPRGTLLVLEAITLEQLILAHGCTRTSVRSGLRSINSLSVSLVVMVSQMS